MKDHHQLGPEFLEAIYQEALAIELSERGIHHSREVALPIFYKSRPLLAHYRADFICFSTIIVELKAVAHLSSIEGAQLINYLEAINLRNLRILLLENLKWM